jgi:hypothetical protein
VHLAMQVAHHVQQHRDVSNVRHHNKDCKHIWCIALVYS